MNEVKKIDLQTKAFVANGVNYKILDKLTIERYKIYQRYAPRLAFGLNFNEIYANLSKLYKVLNNQKFADAAVITHNIMNGIHGIEDDKREEPALIIAGLIIVRENEDVSRFDMEEAKAKIEDWTKEGLAIEDFFILSLNTLGGFRETLIESIRIKSEDFLKATEE